jgi:plastocyanin
MKRTLSLLALSGLVVLSSVALGVGQDATPDSKGSASAGKITGHIRFEGEKPKVKPLTVAAAQAVNCCAAGENVDDQDRSLLIGEKLGIANVVVSLTVKDAKVKVSEEPVVYNQTSCRFEPHVLVVPVGTTVSFKNSDKCVHNVHLYAFHNRGFNRAVPEGKDAKGTFKRAESIKVSCDIHPWMAGWVVVTDATHWALTDAEGGFSLEGIPAGTYELQVWHEKLGKAKTEVTVKAEGAGEPIELKMAPKKPRTRRRK